MKEEDQKISAVINTYNESANIERALEALKGFDEIVVCDMESTDNTRELAEKHGARVVIFPKGDYNICEPARDFAIHSASHPWVLVVDADEIVPGTLRDYLYDYIGRSDCQDALSVPFDSVFMGRFTSTKPERHVRFFRQSKATWPPTIHSHVQISGSTGMIPPQKELRIKHLDNPTVSQRITKLNRYSDNEVGKRKNRTFGTMSLLLRPWWFFIKTLLLRGSIRDGKRGIIRAYIEMMYQIALVSKNIESRLNEDDKA